ncbi:MAG: META domain-containing protein [Polyangiales bacterium]
MNSSVRSALYLLLAISVIASGCKKGKDAANANAAATEGLEPSGKLALEGMYSYMADAGLLADCATGVKWRVATEGDNAALESAYAKARNKPGDALLVTVEGRLELREKIDRTGKEKVLIVDRFVRVWPRETCGSLLPAGLEGSNWSLLELNGKPVGVADASRAPFLEFNATKKSAFGFGGCNRFFGSYQTGKNGALEVGALGATRMACPDNMNQEQVFLDTLGKVTRYEIHGSKLLLYAGPTLVARFQARNLLQTD